MSLLRLLTAGKSLVGLKDTASRYNVARTGSLPQFSPKKNPFRASTRPEFNPGAQPEAQAAANSVERTAEDPLTPAPTAVPVVAPSSPVIPVSAAPSNRADKPKSPSPWAALLSWRRRKAEKPGVPKFSKPMIQGELSLDSVKVVRNDLSDTDLEIVPARPAAAIPQPNPAGQPEPGPAADGWGEGVGRAVGAGKT